MEYLTDQHDTEELSDEEALDQSLSDPECFRVLVLRYEAALLRAVGRIVRNPEDAREVVQDAFIRMYAAAPRFRQVEGASFRSWAYTIALNVAKTRYRKMQKERNVRMPLDPEWYEVLPDPENAHATYVLREDLLVALSKLPEHFKRVLTLQFLEGKNQEEIADEEGVSVGAVKTRVHRAKAALRNIINQQTVL